MFPVLFIFVTSGMASFRRQPKMQNKGYDGDAADAGKPEASEPQQAPGKRSRRFLGHQ
jgi:hypothetical protein